jgi:hypothetical protein
LRLPTLAVPVTLAMIGRATTAGELFVADVPRSGRAQLLDDVAAVLDDVHATFVPARVADRVQLLAKHALGWVALDVGGDVTLHDRQHHVTVELATGPMLEGTLLDDAPHDRPRVIDHLNGTGSFVRLWTATEHYLINKTQIVQVTELPAARSER